MVIVEILKDAIYKEMLIHKSSDSLLRGNSDILDNFLQYIDLHLKYDNMIYIYDILRDGQIYIKFYKHLLLRKSIELAELITELGVSENDIAKFMLEFCI